ncbi:nitric oxide synthase oxygenase [Salinispora sp. H7-4]|nr:nitric oxide synthase oxygenase [Salinispora sp. H7-4]
MRRSVTIGSAASGDSRVENPTSQTITPSDDTAEDPSEEAVEFISAYYQEQKLPHVTKRITDVLSEIATTGTYWQTPGELTYGAKVAWRQSVRCIGRIRWAGLKVRDCRTVATAKGISNELAEHLRLADNGGRIRSVLTVFAADHPQAGPRARIWNDQLIRYGGWQRDDEIVGDPSQLDMTGAALKLGWQPPATPGRFDILPWVIETATEEPTLVDPPRDLVREIRLTHPDHAWFADLQLRWHALPVIANMRLRIGGVDYSCAPFNGHYLSDEIGTRNMCDAARYNQLRPVAARLGLDTEDESSLWREHAALVINQSVIHSFRAAGVRISVPNNESEMFMRFCNGETREGRPVYGDWSWINGSVGWAALHAVHHRYYDTRIPNPNFWPAPRAPFFSEPTLRERSAAPQQEG